MKVALIVSVALTMGIVSGCAGNAGSSGTRMEAGRQPQAAAAPVQRMQDPRVRPPGSTDPMSYDARQRYYEGSEDKSQ